MILLYQKQIFFTPCIIAFILLTLYSNSFSQGTLGGGFSYGFGFDKAGLQINGLTQLSETARFGVEIKYWISREERIELGFELEEKINQTLIEFNTSLNVALSQRNSILFYGIGSVGFHYYLTRYGISISGPTDIESGFDESKYDFDVGFGIGIGFEYRFEKTTFFSEPVYYINGFDQFALSAGVRFPIQ